ncbi:autotransporter domain-containing protein [Bradyrhizobium diazoefficiens]|nr:autotransporter domain-containing protein [Bradyrhizobium diazoefficiens]MBR0850190.1 autotransporter domain-containing protein [Bradyrhizobium diazoefficiens]
MEARVAHRAGVGGSWADDPRQARLIAIVRPQLQPAPRRRTAWLTGASLGIIALTGVPPRAFAACLGENSASVTCDATNQASAGTLATSFAGTTMVNVNAGGKIDTGGASATVTAAGSLTFNNNDATFGITNKSGTGVALANDFGAITYAGSGAVTATSTVPVAGLSATSNAATGGIDLTTGGPISVTTSFGATAISAAINNAANASAISVQIDNSVNVTSLSKNTAVDVSTSGLGGITVTDNGVITTNFNAINAWISNSANASALTVHVNNDTSGFIRAQHDGTGSLLIDGTGAVGGIFALGNGDVTVKVSNDVSGAPSDAVSALIGSSTSTGTLAVSVTKGNITAGLGAGKVFGPGNGILASTAGLGTTSVTLSSAPVVSGAIGILASATNASSTADIIVSSDATITGIASGGGKGGKGGKGGFGGSPFHEFDAAGLATTGVGIGVSHSGTGNIRVTTGASSAIVADSVGIQLLSGGAAMQSGGNISATIGGTVNAGGSIGSEVGVLFYGGTANTLTNTGLISGATGVRTIGGSVTVDNAGLITTSNVIAVQLGGSGNVFIMDGPNAALGGLAVGSGNDTFRLAGTGANTFDVSRIDTGWTSLEKTGSSTWTLTGTSAYSGNLVVSAGTLLLTGAGNLGAVTNTLTISGGTLDLGGTTQTLAALSLAGGTLQNGNLNAPVNSTGGTISSIGGSASLTTTAGITTLFGINAYTGATTVNGGVLDVEGSITGTSSLSVNAGGVLMGAGIIDPLTVTLGSGATFAPGNGTPGSSTKIIGDLAFQAGAAYLVQINPSAANFAGVTGAATLGGATVDAVFARGNSISKQYTILTASGGVSGTFGSLVNVDLPKNFSDTLGYDATHAYLNLTLDFGNSNNLNRNQQAVGNGLSSFFNANGSIPLVFGTATPAGLTQFSGESATGSQQSTFQAMSEFINLLTDSLFGRGNRFNGTSSPAGYADEESASSYAATKRLARERGAYMAFTKAPLARSYEPRWSVWVSPFGGAQSTSGNASLGSNDASSRIAGMAVGADYLFSPNTLAGFALAGGGTSFAVNNLGSGHSDLFQAGAYVRHASGPAYVSAALAYGWQDITTDRTVAIAGFDRLRAEFNANAWSGRVEGGYRLVAPVAGGIGVTPYAAAQFTSFALPAYIERAVVGTNLFALGYNSRTVTDTRSELGVRSDKSLALQTAILTLRGRFAWAHDFNPDRAIAATFQTLPGASFVVNGARQASDAALTTAAVEAKWLNGWSAAASFEGEFSSATRSYAGKGVARYQW